MRRHGQVIALYNCDSVWSSWHGDCDLPLFLILFVWITRSSNCSDSWCMCAVIWCLRWQLIGSGGCSSHLYVLLTRNVGKYLNRLASFFGVQVLKLLQIPVLKCNSQFTRSSGSEGAKIKNMVIVLHKLHWQCHCNTPSLHLDSVITASDQYAEVWSGAELNTVSILNEPA